MKSFGDFLTGLAAFLWPAAIISGGYYFRNHIRLLLDAVRVQFASGAAFRWKDFEFRGIELLSFDARSGETYRTEPADRAIFDGRHQNYEKNKNLFLVHMVRATGRVFTKTTDSRSTMSLSI
jgi:hypothetical protein